jgi:hypothetical protein
MPATRTGAVYETVSKNAQNIMMFAGALTCYIAGLTEQPLFKCEELFF